MNYELITNNQWALFLQAMLKAHPSLKHSQMVLTLYHTMTPFDAPGKQAFCKHRGKRRNCS